MILLIPVPQKNLPLAHEFNSDYAVPGGTYRENLRNSPGDASLDSRHPGTKHKWNYVPPKTEANDAKLESSGTNETAPHAEVVVPISDPQQTMLEAFAA